MFGSILENYGDQAVSLFISYVVSVQPAAFTGCLPGINSVYDSLNGVPIHEQLAIRADSHMNINQQPWALRSDFGCMVALDFFSQTA
jgi:hypothetical protein